MYISFHFSLLMIDCTSFSITYPLDSIRFSLTLFSNYGFIKCLAIFTYFLWQSPAFIRVFFLFDSLRGKWLYHQLSYSFVNSYFASRDMLFYWWIFPISFFVFFKTFVIGHLILFAFFSSRSLSLLSECHFRLSFNFGDVVSMLLIPTPEYAIS